MSTLVKAAQMPNLSVDCVLFGFKNKKLHVLLIKQAFPKKSKHPFESQFALPGNLVFENESLDEAANRVLKELTGVENIFLEQFKTFGNPDRVNDEKDRAWLLQTRQKPDARVVTVAYYSLINAKNVHLLPGGFSSDVLWVEIKDIPPLAFDHNQIVDAAIERIKLQIQLKPIGSELLPKKFTMTDLQGLYENILGVKLDKRNFKRKMVNSGLLHAMEERKINSGNKPAQFYRFVTQNSAEIELFYNLRFDSTLG